MFILFWSELTVSFADILQNVVWFRKEKTIIIFFKFKLKSFTFWKVNPIQL